MGITDELAGGKHGVIVAAPPGMSLPTEAPRSARYKDEQGSQLWLTYHPQVHIDLGDADFPRPGGPVGHRQAADGRSVVDPGPCSMTAP